MNRRSTRLLYLLVAAATLYLATTAVFGERGLLTVYGMKAEAARLDEKRQNLQEEKAELARQAERLRTSDAALERVAREELHYMRPNETVFHFVEENGDEEAR